MPSSRSERPRERRRPFAAYYREWLATYARHHCKPGTIAGYEAAGRLYLIPRLGNRDVRSITREDVKRLVYETLLPGRARATVRANLAPLRELFNHAAEDGLVTSNPAAHVLKRMRGERVRAARAPRFLSATELRSLFEACRTREPRWYPFVLVLARTGHAARRGVCAAVGGRRPRRRDRGRPCRVLARAVAGAEERYRSSGRSQSSARFRIDLVQLVD